MVRIARGARLKVSKLGGHGFTHDQRARVLAKRDRRRIGHRPVPSINRRTVSCWQICCVEQVLHSQRQAVQRAANRPCVQPTRLRQHGVRVKLDKGMHRTVTLLNLVQTSAGQFHSTQ